MVIFAKQIILSYSNIILSSNLLRKFWGTVFLNLEYSKINLFRTISIFQFRIQISFSNRLIFGDTKHY